MNKTFNFKIQYAVIWANSHQLSNILYEKEIEESEQF